MTAQEPAARRSIILTGDPALPSESSAYRLLRGLGHDVMPVATPDRAISLLQEERTDLMILDVDDPVQVDYLHRLFDRLPVNQQPRQVAVFSHRMDERLSELRTRLSPARLHVFLKPLHLHGLLGVLRQLESQSEEAMA